MENPESDGWVRLHAERSWMRGLQSISPFDTAPPGLLDLVLAFVLGIVYLISLALVIGFLPRPRVNPAEHKLRIGHRTLDFAAVNTAELVTSHGFKKRRDVDLKFGRIGGPKLYVRLIVDDSRVIVRRTRTLPEQIIEGSSIPTKRERDVMIASYPTGLSREEALEAVRNPPR